MILGGLDMKKRLSSQDFLTLSEALCEAGPKVKYQNPNAWTTYLILERKVRNLRNKDETMAVQPRCIIVKKRKKPENPR